LAKRADATIEASARSFIESRLGLGKEKVLYRSGYSAETAKHAYVKQTHENISFANAVANVAFNHENKVVAFGSSFVNPS
jgi:extracellular elastinolytic metalloproteinase